jgi:hypothetical protein
VAVIRREAIQATEMWMTNPDVTMKDKKEVLENDRQISSYRDHAEANADLDLGGRFAKVTTTTFVGASPISYPRLPQDAPANQAAMVGDEPPLGYDINAMETDERQEEQAVAPRRSRSWRRI